MAALLALTQPSRCGAPPCLCPNALFWCPVQGVRMIVSSCNLDINASSKLPSAALHHLFGRNWARMRDPACTLLSGDPGVH